MSAALAVALGLGNVVTAPARGEPPPKPKGLPQYEISGGGEIAGPSWSAYSTTVVALSALSKSAAGGIREDGWRLRAGAGYWRYADDPVRWVPGIGERKVSLKRTGSFADLLLGYQKGFGELTVKAYAGIAYSNEGWLQDGADAGSPGSDISAKVLVESWLNLTPASFAQLDAGWSSLRKTVTARARLGYRVLPSLSIGPEAGYWSAVDAESDTGVAAWRYGAFIRFEWASGEVSVSAGASDEARGTDFYATINALMRF
jgi:hypothetical protein